MPALGGRRSTRRRRVLTEAGLKLKVEEAAGSIRRCRRARSWRRSRPPASRTRRERSVKVWVSAGPRSTSSRRSSANPSARRSCACSRTGSSRRASPRSARRTTPPGRSSRRSAAARRAGAQVALLVNRGERGATLRDARSHRRQRRAGRGTAAHPRLPGHGGRRSPLSRRRRRASSCGRIRRRASRSRPASRSRSRSAARWAC